MFSTERKREKRKVDREEEGERKGEKGSKEENVHYVRLWIC